MESFTPSSLALCPSAGAAVGVRVGVGGKSWVIRVVGDVGGGGVDEARYPLDGAVMMPLQLSALASVASHGLLKP